MQVVTSTFEIFLFSYKCWPALTSPILDSAASPVDCLEWCLGVRTDNLKQQSSYI